MKLTDTRDIKANPQVVWDAILNPEVLKECIPGCESLELSAPNEMTAKVTLKVGPVKASFGGKVTLSEIDAPNGYRITGEGSGGVAGFAKGGAVIRLESDGADATILHYTADAQICGKLAQLGSRLIDSTAQKLAGDFFTSFATALAPAAPTPATEDAASADEGEKKGWFKNLFGKAETTASLLAIAALGLLAAHACCLDPAHAGMDFPICSAGSAT